MKKIGYGLRKKKKGGVKKLEDEEVKEFNRPYKDVQDLDERTIIKKEIFDYIFYFEDPIEREGIIIELEKRAKELKIPSNFKRILKQYEKKYLNESKNEGSISKQSHNEVADILLENNNIVLYENDLFIYKDGVYSKDETKIERKIIEIIPDATSHFREEVYKILKLKLEPKEKFDREKKVINFKNGLFSIKERKMYEHTASFFSINQINTNLNFTAPKVRAIDDVLDKLSCGIAERKRTILEMIGYSMTTSIALQKAFILYGNTAQNGKSTLINIITELIGNENVGTVPFKELSKNKFAGSGIRGKLLNVGSEMTDEFIEDVSNFKMYITGDEVEVEEKFKPRRKIKPYAKFIFSANELPTVADKTDGFYRRLQIIPLEYSFTNKDRKTFDFNELVTKEALEYLAKISIEAYLNMKENFSNYEESEDEVNKYRTTGSSVLSFINDEEYITSIVKSETRNRFAKEIYALYKNYCIENQYRPIGRNKFYKEFEKSKLIVIGEYQHQKIYTFNLDFYNKN